MTRVTSRQLKIAAVTLCGTIAGAAAIVASFLFLTEFAVSTGWPRQYAFLLPLCLDALGATALLIYGSRPKEAHFAGLVAVGAIVASMLGNAAAHWFAGGWLDPGWVAYTLSGFVPAITIGLIIHLLATKGSQLWAPASTTPAAPTTSPTNGASDAASGDASSSAGTDAKPRRKATSTTGTANAATLADGGDLDWEDFTTWPAHLLKQRTFDQLMQWVRAHGLTDHPTGPSLTGRMRVSKKTAQRIQRQLASEAPSNDSTSPEDSPLVGASNGWH